MLFQRLPYKLNRLQLRALRKDDFDAFYAYRNDVAVARFQGWAAMTTAEAAEFLETQTKPNNFVPGTWRQLAIANLADDLLIGDVGVWLSPDCSTAEFGLSIARTAQGQGYGTECVTGLLDLLFAATPVTEVVASTDIRNAACLAVLTRSGMQHADTRQAEYKGELCTEHVFAIRRAAASNSA